MTVVREAVTVTCNISQALTVLLSVLCSSLHDDPPLLTGEPDAAQRRPIIPVCPGDGCLHGPSDSSVIQQQQAAPVRHVHLTQ